MIDLNVSCDNRDCQKDLEDGDAVYCEGCYSELEEEIAELKNTITELEGKIEAMEIPT